MSRRPLETTGADPYAQVLVGQRLVNLVLFGVFAGILAFALGRPLVGIAGYSLVVVYMIVWPVLRDRSITFDLYEDRAVANHLVGGKEVPYSEVAFVVRTAESGDERRGTADFEFVRQNGDNVTFENVVAPDRVEAVLEDYLPSPGEWMRNHTEDDTALWAIQRRRWWHDRYYGDAETETPPFEMYRDEPAFVESDRIEPDLLRGVDVLSNEDFEALVDFGTYGKNFDRLDSVDEVTHVNDIEPHDVAVGSKWDTGRTHEEGTF